MASLEPFRSPRSRAQFIEKYDAILRSWPVDPEERDVATSFGSTHVVVTGADSAPPLVLFHGAALTASMWGPIIAPVSDIYRCYCIDTITDGNKSVATKRVRGVVDYVDWLAETFSALSIENADVAGLSYGGWLASLLGVHAPELVNRLVLMSPAATLARIATQWLVRMVSATILPSHLAQRSLLWAASRPDAASDPVMALAVAKFLSCRATRPLPPPTTLTDDELRRISAPTTVLLGEREVIYAGGPQAALARANGLISDVHARLLPNAGHVLTLDAPDVVIDELIKLQQTRTSSD
jgi:pimeloyl-ACP methyl ester carboxylesterase